MIANQTQCGTCLFLSGRKVFDKPCDLRGKVPTSKACGEHKPNMFQLVQDSTHVVKVDMMREVLRDLSPKRLDLLAEFIKAEKTTRKNGYKFGQIVYVRFAGQANFLQNFLKGRVLMADRKHVYVIGESGKTYLTLLNEKNSTTLYTIARFRPLRALMVEERKLSDPSLKKLRTIYSVPMLDEVPEDRITNRNAESKRAVDNSLVSMIRKMSEGIYEPKPKRSATKKKTESAYSDVDKDSSTGTKATKQKAAVIKKKVLTKKRRTGESGLTFQY